MSDFRRRLAFAVVAFALALGLSSCGEGVVLPDEGAPAEIEIVSGNTQSGAAGTTLGQPLVVRVTDSGDRPVADQQVEFAIDAGDGQVAPASAMTDADGRASTVWTLGPAAGAQRVRARPVGGGAPSNLVVSFTATAFSGSAGRLVLVGGDGQGGAVGTELAQPLVVRVTDGLGNPVSGVTVTWSVSGGGSVNPASAESDDEGLVSVTRVLGPSAGAQSAQAISEGLEGSPITFNHVADASTPTELRLVSGDLQTAPAGFQLPDPLVVRLVDENGNGVPGRTVTWIVPAGAGAVNPVNSITSADGHAETRWTLSSTVGTFTLNAVFSGVPSVPFTATATADAPTTLSLVSGNGQSGTVGTTLSSPLRVRVTDANGNGVSNVGVNWAAVGGGSVSAQSSGTDAQGIAQVNRTLGPTPGSYSTTATVAGLTGSPVTFTATGNVGPPNQLAWIVQPTGAVVGQTLAAMQVEVRDAQGNRVPGATNTVTLTSSVAGSLSGDNDVSAVDGVATFNAISLTRAGTFRLTARASGISNDQSDPFTIAKGETTIEITGRSPTTSVTGQSVTVSYAAAAAAPASGNLTGSVTVSSGSASNSCPISSNGSGNCQLALGAAGSPNLVIAYNGDANFNASTSAPVGHTVNKAGTTVNIGNVGAATQGEALTVPFSVSVNNPGSASPTAPGGNVVVTLEGGPESNTCPVSAGSCEITPQSGGSRTLTVTYQGDANFNGSSDSETIAVRTPTTTSVSSTGNTVFGQTVTFTATVAPVPPGSGTPTGSVQFKADGTNIGGPVTLTAGTAARSTNTLGAGSHVITAEYTPSGSSFGASTGTLNPNHQVSQAGTTTVITGDSPDPSDPGESYTVSVSVSSVVPGGPDPTGTVGINDGEGGSCTATLSSGTGSCDLSSATSGAKTLTATYNGSANYTGSSGTGAHQVNSPPTAEANSYGVFGLLLFEAAPGVLGNDGDPDGDPITAVLDASTSNGSLNLNADGSFLYTPNLGFLGTDSFTYHAFDGSLSSPTVTVTLVVGP